MGTTTHPTHPTTETPVAVILHGFPGTGKSTLARRLAASHTSWVVIDKDDVKSKLAPTIDAHAPPLSAVSLVSFASVVPQERSWYPGAFSPLTV